MVLAVTNILPVGTILAISDWHYVNDNHIVLFLSFHQQIVRIVSRSNFDWRCRLVHRYRRHHHCRVETNHSKFVDHQFVMPILIRN